MWVNGQIGLNAAPRVEEPKLELTLSPHPLAMGDKSVHLWMVKRNNVTVEVLVPLLLIVLDLGVLGANVARLVVVVSRPEPIESQLLLLMVVLHAQLLTLKTRNKTVTLLLV